MKNIFKMEPGTKRIFGLDLLRAFAILCVILAHGSPLLPKQMAAISDLFVFDGVSIFFVLSGFLIGGIFIKAIENKEISKQLLLNFWTRRWLRTLPAYFLILLLLIIFHVGSTGNFNFLRLGSYFIFSQNLVQVHPDFFPEAWSLSVEEWFYVSVPLLIAAAIKLLKLIPQKSVMLIAALLIISITLFRCYRFLSAPPGSVYEWDSVFRKQVITRLDSLMFGVIGASIHYYHFNKWIRYKKTLLCTGIVLLLVSRFYPTSVDGIFAAVFSFTLISVATLCLLPFLNDLKSGSGIFYKPVTCISLISYSMYLLNLSVIRIGIIDAIPWTTFFSNSYLLLFFRYGSYWLLVITLSILLYKYFEMPMTRLRDRKKELKTVLPPAVPLLVVPDGSGDIFI